MISSLLDLFRTKPVTAVTREPALKANIPAVVVTHAKTGTEKVVPVATRSANRWVAGGAAAALAVSVIGGNEGVVLLAYPDPISKGEPFTICFGHTGPDVTPGLRLSMQQCKDIFSKDLAKHWEPVVRCTGQDVVDKWPNSRAVAVLDLVYNMGGGNYCKSVLPALFKAGRTDDACDAIMQFDHAFGHRVSALTARRARDRKLCLENI